MGTLEIKPQISRALAMLLPANLVWVFLACALLCVTSSEPACNDDSDQCCSDVVVVSSDTTLDATPQRDLCLLVTADPAVAVDRASADERLPSPVGTRLWFDDRSRGFVEEVPAKAVDPPPKWRPSDRNTVIQV